MRRTRLYAAILSVVMLIAIMPWPAAADDVSEVSTPAELRAALESDAGAHVRLKKDIIFTKSNAVDANNGVVAGRGNYTVDLNGFTIKYHHYTPGREFSDGGTPIHAGHAKSLVINGPGNLIGGTHGLEQGDQFCSLTVNNVTVKGIMGYGIRVTGGLVYLNGGDIVGNFGSLDHEDGLVVINGAKVGKITHVNRGQQLKNYALIRDGVLSGNAVLDCAILSVDNLTIAKGSSVKVAARGGLIVAGNFVNNGSYIREGGLQSLGGAASVKRNMSSIDPHGEPAIFTDMEFSTLDIEEGARLLIENGATVTVTGAFSSGVNSFIQAKDGNLKLLGSIDHKGFIDGASEFGGEAKSGPHGESAALQLKRLGLFHGVGTNPDGSTNFALNRAPSRVEAMIMLVRLLGKYEEAVQGTWSHPFTDVPAWADAVVGYSYENKLTSGISATKFGSTNIASVQMYLTFVLRALGYSSEAGGDFTWDKPEELAGQAGILSPNVQLKNFMRADVAIVSEAALNARLKGSHENLLGKLIKEGVVASNEKSEALEALTASGLGSVTLTKDEVINVSGLSFGEGKEIILNGFSLTLVGALDISENPHLDIYLGEGAGESVLDLSHFRIDSWRLPEGSSGEWPVMEIHSGIEVIMPSRPEDLSLSGGPELFVLTYRLTR